MSQGYAMWSIEGSESGLPRLETDVRRIDNIIKTREPERKWQGMKRIIAGLVIGLVMTMGLNAAMAGNAGTKEEAVAMVKKAIEYIKANGNEKAFAEFSNPNGQFVDRDLYVVVYDMNAKCLAHGANPKMIGRDLINNKDIDGKEFMKERVELMKKQTSAWQEYKFRNPVTNKIEPKEMYIERYQDLIVGCGVYKQ
jgi:cytochrome c